MSASSESHNLILQGSVTLSSLLLKDGEKEQNESSQGRNRERENADETILVVNDDQDQLDLMCLLLQQSGYHICTAKDGRQGYEVALAELPDLVISDVSMPGLNGIEMCGLIRERRELQTTPILLVSAVCKDSASAIQGLTAGADDYLEAPYDPMRLVVKVAQLIERRRGEANLRESEERYRVVAETATDVILTIDETSTILYANRSVERVFGYSVADVIGRSITDLMPKYLSRLYTLALDRQSAGERQPHSWDGIELTGVTKEGREFPLEISFGEFTKGGKRFFTGIARDISERKHADEARLMLAAIVESSEDAIIGMTLGGEITTWNAGAMSMYGYTAAEAIGQSTSLVIPEDRAHELREILERIRLGERLRNCETVRLRKDGSRVEVSVSSSPIMDHGGRIVGASTTARDISEQRRVQEALRESDRRFRAYIENASDNITIITSGGTTIYESPAVERLTGYRPGELIGEYAFAHVHPEDLVKVSTLLPAGFRIGETIGPVEYRYFHKNGSVATFESFGKSHLDERGGVVGIINTRDITERRLMEEALRLSEERYRGLFENANDIIYTQDLQGNYTSVNKVAEAVTGYALDEVLHMNYSQFFPAEETERIRRMTERKLSGETDSTSYEVSLRTKDGAIVQLDVSTTLIYENGRPVGIQGIARDITERNRAAEALRTSQAQLQQSQKLEAIGQLAGGVAHDFNNLLTAINGYTDLSLRYLDERHSIRRNLEEIKKAAARAASLTRQLLAFSRKQILEPRILDLNLVVKDMSKMLRRLIGEDIELHTTLKNDLGKVQADPGQVEQIIMNLVVNARDAMPQGGKVTIETANVTVDETYAMEHVMVQTGEYVMLAVTDTGSGIDEETQTHIFEPFFTTKEAGKGTGLGLSTVYGIVKQSGGYVWIYSEVGVGTSFKVYLPRLDEQPQVEKSRALVGSTDVHGTETVLLVEDDAMVRRMARMILELHGYRVLEAEHADAALQIFQEHKDEIDLMLTDVIMPGMSGRVLAERLAELSPELPVIYMSGYTDDAIVRHGLLSDELDFIQKPFSPDGLAQKIRTVLDARDNHTRRE
jgi:PAS domain S-box-containing protein